MSVPQNSSQVEPHLMTRKKCHGLLFELYHIHDPIKIVYPIQPICPCPMSHSHVCPSREKRQKRVSRAEVPHGTLHHRGDPDKADAQVLAVRCISRWIALGCSTTRLRTNLGRWDFRRRLCRRFINRPQLGCSNLFLWRVEISTIYIDSVMGVRGGLAAWFC